MAATDISAEYKNDKVSSIWTGGFRYKEKCKKNVLFEISVPNDKVPGLLKV